MNISHITLSRGRMSLPQIEAVLAKQPDTHGFFRSTTLATSVVAYIAMYYILAPRYTTTKQKAWVLTTIASALMTIASIPFLWDYIRSWGSVTSLRSLPIWSYGTCRIFQAYLISDLCMGLMHYREHVNLLTGWGHHTFYIWAVNMAVNRDWSRIFCLLAIMEFPTFVLALASLYPQLRSNVLFAVSFFATRIMLHIVWCISFMLPKNRPEATGDSIIPAMLLLIVLPLHALWFKGCVMGFVKRHKARKQAATLTAEAIQEDIEDFSVAVESTLRKVEELEISELMPELTLPEPAMTATETHEEKSGTIVKVYLADQPEPKSPRRDSLRKYLPPSPKALYDFVGLSQNVTPVKR